MNTYYVSSGDIENREVRAESHLDAMKRVLQAASEKESLGTMTICREEGEDDTEERYCLTVNVLKHIRPCP